MRMVKAPTLRHDIPKITPILHISKYTHVHIGLSLFLNGRNKLYFHRKSPESYVIFISDVIKFFTSSIHVVQIGASTKLLTTH